MGSILGEFGDDDDDCGVDRFVGILVVPLKL